MFIWETFHQGIEPLFNSGFPHKSDLFYYFDTIRRRLCLIGITGTSCWSLSFQFRCFLSSKLPNRDSNTITERSHCIFEQHPFDQKGLSRPLTFGRHKTTVLRGKTTFGLSCLLLPMKLSDFWIRALFAHKTAVFWLRKGLICEEKLISAFLRFGTVFLRL